MTYENKESWFAIGIIIFGGILLIIGNLTEYISIESTGSGIIFGIGIYGFRDIFIGEKGKAK